ncbi:hypothetical protein N474_23555 [Pseudoalteromonas luteoviolacea CPMOR-2]|uniref:ADP-ribosylglycohydrolase n=1 Tax=Pseudoalteromonas luteoviolacea DSM 6061 TaxID=1365250 RepID=A0A166ZAC2_9GAMM|nr:ADP-ribosylglycohydrolase family protein [Pseudoalteromonas luteoviolacea]KZN44106.1 hypothetical protein N475_08330 [Pseudoalteromonas luteoviolacea DSM 6061]KZN52195.1 hypothetical protein N474_23555 [Pseudoalteromonas luteoviolacea CPMOR-2]MBE0386219.1 hypothetical protein [Pseudoalteromonas luteoviolacea DSM 6061]
MIEQAKFVGCFKALAIADACGACFEGGALERALWYFVGKTSDGKLRYTDDTQMSIDVANSFLANHTIDQNHLAKTFGNSYHWSRGYGPSAAKLLKGIHSGKDFNTLNKAKFKDGSKGNGAAMRAPVVAICNFISQAVLKEDITKTAEITHAHPEAIEGAFLIARATQLALIGVDKVGVMQTLCTESKLWPYKQKLVACYKALTSSQPLDSYEIKHQFGNGMLSIDSVVTALYYAFSYRHKPLTQMIEDACSLGGDTDTICAMAGGIWGAYNGDATLNGFDQQIEGLEQISEIARNLHARYVSLFS